MAEESATEQVCAPGCSRVKLFPSGDQTGSWWLTGGLALPLVTLLRACGRPPRIRPRAARLVEGRYFGGLNLDDMARVLGMSERTTMRDWAFAKAWLFRELSEVTNPS